MDIIIGIYGCWFCVRHCVCTSNVLCALNTCLCYLATSCFFSVEFLSPFWAVDLRLDCVCRMCGICSSSWHNGLSEVKGVYREMKQNTNAEWQLCTVNF